MGTRSCNFSNNNFFEKGISVQFITFIILSFDIFLMNSNKIEEVNDVIAHC